LVEAQQGIFYIVTEHSDQETSLKLLASYAFKERRHLATEYKLGEGLVGQCAWSRRESAYRCASGLHQDYIRIGRIEALSIVVLPVLFEGQIKAVVELAPSTGSAISILAFLDQLTESIGTVLNTITATMRTESCSSNRRRWLKSCRAARNF